MSATRAPASARLKVLRETELRRGPVLGNIAAIKTVSVVGIDRRFARAARRLHSSGSVVNISGSRRGGPASVASVAFVSATSFV